MFYNVYYLSQNRFSYNVCMVILLEEPFKITNGIFGQVIWVAVPVPAVELRPNKHKMPLLPM